MSINKLLRFQKNDKNSGYILLLTLVITLLMIIIVLALLKSNIYEEFVAGNLSQKTTAINSTKSALNYAERWVSGNGYVGQSCTTNKVYQNPVICKSTNTGTFNPNNLLLPTSNASAIGSIYTEGNLVANNNGGKNIVYQLPRYYIQYIGTVTNGAGIDVGDLYRITAAGYGGSKNAVAIIQAYYKVYSPSTNLAG